MQRILASSGDIVNCGDGHNGKTALMYAVHCLHADTAREHGASLEAFDIGRGYTALMWASVRGHAETARVLVEHGASLKVVDNWGSNALKLAEMSGRYGSAVVAVLKEHMAKGGSKSDNQGCGSQ